jgi:hypothetical protein
VNLLSFSLFFPLMPRPTLIQPIGNRLQRSPIWTIGASMGLILVVTVSGCAKPQASTSSTPVNAVTDEEVVNYAKSVLAIEVSRQVAVKEIQQITQTEEVPVILCSQSETLNKLAKAVQAIAITYCNRAKQAGENSGFNMARFNAITATLPGDVTLSKRIQDELIRLQKSSPPQTTPAPQPSADAVPAPEVSPAATP